jgi:transposase-like protein
MKNIINVLEKSIEDYIHYNPENSIENLVITMFETILKCERQVFLNESPIWNKANGYYERMAKALTKYFTLRIPRDRLGLFKPIFLEVIKERESQMAELASKLYVKGLTTREIEDVFNDVFERKMSPAQVSLISKSFQDEREAWLNRDLLSEYYFIYVDAIFTSIRRDTVEKEAMYIVIGLRPDLKREIFGVYNIPTESASGWAEVFKDLKRRGLKNVLMVIADGLTGLEEVVKEELPASFLQKCLVHKYRNVLLKARPSHKLELAQDLREVFRLEDPYYTIEQGKTNLQIFIDKWKKHYPYIERRFKQEHLENYFAYLNFPYQIHRMIYTTNWIERLNKSIRRTIKIRNSFPNPESAINLICSSLIEFEENVYKYPVTSFLEVQDKLEQMLLNSVQQTQFI